MPSLHQCRHSSEEKLFGQRWQAAVGELSLNTDSGGTQRLVSGYRDYPTGGAGGPVWWCAERANSYPTFKNTYRKRCEVSGLPHGGSARRMVA